MLPLPHRNKFLKHRNKFPMHPPVCVCIDDDAFEKMTGIQSKWDVLEDPMEGDAVLEGKRSKQSECLDEYDDINFQSLAPENAQTTSNGQYDELKRLLPSKNTKALCLEGEQFLEFIA